MTRKLDIESRLERSLVNQVKAPQLGKKFDASVWARIEAESQHATNPVLEQARPSTSARWLMISNVVGIAVTVLVVAVFAVQSFSGVSVNVPTVEVPAATLEQIYKVAGQAIGFAALVFGLMFTPIGRRLRAEFT
jgi:hypothetical protein